MTANIINPSPKLLNVKEVAGMLSVSSATVNKWMKTNGLPYLKLGKAVRFMESDLLAWIADQRHTSDLADSGDATATTE